MPDLRQLATLAVERQYFDLIAGAHAREVLDIGDMRVRAPVSAFWIVISHATFSCSEIALCGLEELEFEQAIKESEAELLRDDEMRLDESGAPASVVLPMKILFSFFVLVLFLAIWIISIL